MSDVLSEVLDLIGVQSSVYFQEDFCAPWGMCVENTGFAQFHIIVSGEAVVTYNGEPERLSTGDIILFPTGGGHVIGDSPETQGIPGPDLIVAVEGGKNPFSGNGRRTRMVCGHFQYDLDHKHPLIQELPPMLLLRGADIPDVDVLMSLIRLLVRESLVLTHGGSVIVRHLSAALLVAILRTYFRTNGGQIGFHAGLMDAKIARALLAIHNEPPQGLRLDNLAQVAGMSRSSFAARFKTIVGQTPGDYITRWNLLKAVRSLANLELSIEQIALDAGYQSSTAFSRAFQRLFDETPSSHRRRLF